MRILLVSQYFWPESFIINDLARELVAQGNEVTVLTGKPNYPDGKVFADYQQDGVSEELFEGTIRVLRVPLRPRGRGALNLMRNYLSFVVSGLLHFPRLARSVQADTILVFAPSPITAAIPAILLKMIRRMHLALWVQDLWPESLAATGFVRNPFLLWLAGLMVRAIYAGCDTLLVQSRAFTVPVARYAAASKILYYPNSMADAADSVALALPADLIALLEGKFCAVFAGNIGTAQAVETLVDSAERLHDLPDFRLVLVGSGSRLEWVREECARRGLDNVVLAGRFPMQAMPAIFMRAQALLVTLKNETIFAYTVPSKVQAYMAAGRPLVAALDGEGARIVEEAGAGLICAAEDGAGLAQRLRALHAMAPEERARMGQAGRRYFLEHFEMGKLAYRLTDLLQARIHGKHS
ncbi:glycosyltransferase family 4 protein [Laribacter hongkongensis]|uniref:Glycosyltransferase family 4 protein n=1 Tax=Laribacter hongkongensis TaxID=168471 RepID=A0ABD4SSQ5_9NEIS|nr:glycosyltransferase family 4 protein [Laribacter hongkongensis]MCG9026042.1 glycosyltransferase family 4 protein [Laribacter hongkongensis]MCG9116300.1 glycosyltransferase family 4 protein [Laribacter hongkongensis]MCG9124943.1 glycosyltransferase family 4 protein [Laribacter hongkongensis]